ncbi:globin domain-containing protein [Kineococcus sp. SYSU DK018]|uniref:globin domain-containing protein n=1 Tax=Kineococcus sp. SYSU DK018 TaxID=3383139 RepID=UPI003D7DF0E0
MDVAAMRASFAKAAAAGDEAPLFFYSHLFLRHPETRPMFPVSMVHQRDKLFSALGQVVALVDDLDSLVPVLQGLGRDHRKFGTLAAHYPAVGASLLATLRHFDDEWDEDLERDWTAAYGLVSQVMVEAADAVADQPAWWDAKVVGHERRSVDVSVLRVQPHAPLPVRAGQAISVETELRPRLWRYYCPAGVHGSDGALELHVQAHAGGPVSSALALHAGVGDVLRLGPAVGEPALPPESDRDLLVVAAGTGLAPAKALIAEVAAGASGRRVHLFAGAGDDAGLYDLPALRRLESEHPWLTVTPVVSDDPRSAHLRGDLPEVVLQHGPWNARDAHVAGDRRDVERTVQLLTAQGLPRERVRAQVFAPSRSGPDVGGKVSR